MSHFTFIGGFFSILAFFWNTTPVSYQDNYFKLVNKHVKKTYGLEVNGTGTGCKERKIEFFCLEYFYNKEATISSARKIILDVLDDELNILQQFKPIHQEMYVQPITLDALDVGIDFFQVKQQALKPGQVIRVLKVNNKIIYYTRDPECPYGGKEMYSETVEEARAKLQEEALKQDPKDS